MADFKLKLSLVLIISFVSLTLSVVFSRQIFAQTILFQDNFDSVPNGGFPEKWNGSSAWHVQDGEYGALIFCGNKSTTVPKDQLWNPSWNHYSFEAALRGVSGTDKNIVFRFLDEANFYSLHHTGDNLHFAKYINGIKYPFPNFVGNNPIFYPLSNGQTYHFKINV